MTNKYTPTMIPYRIYLQSEVQCRQIYWSKVLTERFLSLHTTPTHGDRNVYLKTLDFN